MNGGGRRLTVRIYPGTPVAGRFLDAYQEILTTASAHAAGAFLRDCLMRGFAALEADVRPHDPGRKNTHATTEVENTTQNSFAVVCDNDSGVRLDQGNEGHAGAVEAVTAVSPSEDIAGSGVRGMVKRLGLGTAHLGKADE